MVRRKHRFHLSSLGFFYWFLLFSKYFHHTIGQAVNSKVVSLLFTVYCYLKFMVISPFFILKTHDIYTCFTKKLCHLMVSDHIDYKIYVVVFWAGSIEQSENRFYWPITLNKNQHNPDAVFVVGFLEKNSKTFFYNFLKFITNLCKKLFCTKDKARDNHQIWRL